MSPRPKKQFRVVGGKAAGQLIDDDRARAHMNISGDSYLAISFKHDGESVTILMLAGMAPADAAKIWREHEISVSS